MLSKSHEKHIPVAVSIVEHRCDKATNVLRVVFNKKGTKRNFAICVKGMDFPQEDKSVRLIEWLELLRILGAEKIFIYKVCFLEVVFNP